MADLRLEVAMDGIARERGGSRALRQGQRRSMPKIPRWLIGIPKLPGLPVIELRRREEPIETARVELEEKVDLPELSASKIRRPRVAWD